MTLQRNREEDRQKNEEWDRQRTAQARAALLIEREQDRRVADLNRQQADENRRLWKEQKAYRDYLDNDVYTNRPTAAYFMQFNTTTR